jgi:ABC-type transporter MlaC component
MLLVLLALPASSVHSQTSDPIQFVFTFNRDIAAQMGSPSINAAERKRRFATLVDEGLDFDAIGERLLGWRWAQATPADRLAFDREFRNYLIQNFAMKVRGIDDGKMVVVEVHSEGGTVVVLTEVQTAEAAHVPFSWRVTKTVGGWRLCDIIIKNMSMDSVMRSQFDSVLQDTHAELAPLIRLLREKSLG